MDEYLLMLFKMFDVSQLRRHVVSKMSALGPARIKENEVKGSLLSSINHIVMLMSCARGILHF